MRDSGSPHSAVLGVTQSVGSQARSKSATHQKWTAIIPRWNRPLSPRNVSRFVISLRCTVARRSRMQLRSWCSRIPSTSALTPGFCHARWSAFTFEQVVSRKRSENISQNAPAPALVGRLAQLIKAQGARAEERRAFESARRFRSQFSTGPSHALRPSSSTPGQRRSVQIVRASKGKTQ